MNELETLREASRKADEALSTLQSQLAQSSREREIAKMAHADQLRQVSNEKNKAIASQTEIIEEKDRLIRTLRADLHRERSALQKERQDRAQIISQESQHLEEERKILSEMESRRLRPSTLSQTVLRMAFGYQLSLRAQTFVVVLVDGDGYPFCKNLTKAGSVGGVQAAQRMRLEVLRYMETQKDIPTDSKIVVRVFYNGKSKLPYPRKDGTVHKSVFESFMHKFSETQPLFDFLDCGQGKERADSKIRGRLDETISHSKSVVPA